MPVYLRGLGAATAYSTVTVKPRVDGQLINVAFKELESACRNKTPDGAAPEAPTGGTPDAPAEAPAEESADAATTSS